MTRHVVMLSGGIGSWAAGKRVAQKHGSNNLTLLFCDTLIEDWDCYRFLDDAVANLGGEFVRLCDGRDPWQVFRDEGTIANTRVDLCSRILKRDLSDKWLAEHCEPADTIVYLGIDWTEIHRFDNRHGRGAKNRYAKNGWICEAPLCEPPYLDKRDLLAWASREGLTPSRAYEQGMSHDNCGGFCVKAGVGHFAQLLKMRPEIYRHHEEQEAAFPGDRTILRDRNYGETKPLSLRELRNRIEAGADSQIDMFEIGGCGCFL